MTQIAEGQMVVKRSTLLRALRKMVKLQATGEAVRKDEPPPPAPKDEAQAEGKPK